MRDLYYKSSEGFLILYSISGRSSFEAIRRMWDQILHVKDVENVPAVIVGNKSDLEVVTLNITSNAIRDNARFTLPKLKSWQNN